LLTWPNVRTEASSGPLAFTVIPRCSLLDLVRLWCRRHGVETTLGDALSVGMAKVSDARPASEVSSSVEQLHPRFCLGAARVRPGT
jgi:hypothetical protein